MIVNFVFRVIYSKVIIVYYNTPSTEILLVVDFFTSLIIRLIQNIIQVSSILSVTCFIIVGIYFKFDIPLTYLQE